MSEVAVKPPAPLVITYKPLGESEDCVLTIARVRQFLCIPTKSGKLPSDEQVVKYMMLCRAQSLNPWTSDCFLCGYDGKDGPQFSLITAHQALLKRSEASPGFDGMESGVVVQKSDGSILERQGDLMLIGETLVGGWARVHRRDRNVPSYDAVNLKTFDTGRSRWAADPAGMIVKCAEASALRKAFPSTLAAMYCKEEMDRQRELPPDATVVDVRTKTERLTERLIGSSTQTAETPRPVPQESPEPESGSGSPQQPPADNETVKSWLVPLGTCQNAGDLKKLHAEFDESRGSMSPSEVEAIEAAFAARMEQVGK